MKIENDAPLIGVPACVRLLDEQPFHTVGEKYVTAISRAAGGLPLVIPALGDDYSLVDLVGRLDGLMITGSPSNVAARLYGGQPDRPDSPQDPARDATTLPLIRVALAAGLPLLCICRGLQELNVALGGTLHQQVHAVAGNFDHRAPQGVPFDEKYGLRHKVLLTPGGLLSGLLDLPEIEVNSLHWQAIDRLADGLTVEGRAVDGVIEAVRVKDAREFALAVQWHPEYRAAESPVSRALFGAFGAAARSRAAERRRQVGAAA